MLRRDKYVVITHRDRTDHSRAQQITVITKKGRLKEFEIKYPVFSIHFFIY